MVIAAVLMSSITCDRSTSAGFNFLAGERARHEIKAERRVTVGDGEEERSQSMPGRWLSLVELTLNQGFHVLNDFSFLLLRISKDLNCSLTLKVLKWRADTEVCYDYA